MNRPLQLLLSCMLLGIAGCSADQATAPSYGPAAGSENDPTKGMDNMAPSGSGGESPGGGFDPVAIFDRRDENKDDKLTGEELSGRLQDRVSEFDQDGDGELTREEFLEGMQNARGSAENSTDPPASDTPPASDPPASDPPETDNIENGKAATETNE